ncbi:MAG TPA: HAD family hydrolase, partial [Edaphobacter sp.]
VVNVEIGYLHRIEEVKFMPGIVSLCTKAMRLGYFLVVVTNQAGIARGLYTEDDYQALMTWMRAELRSEGVEFDAVYHCPYHPKHGIGDYKREHEDRKPGTGMLRRAVTEFGVSLAESVMVGDRCTDIEAANTAGLKQAFLVAGTEEVSCAVQYTLVHGLDEVERWLLKQG